LLVQAAIRNFVTYNPLFLFSALLLLGGAWLVNPPRQDGGRDGLLQLFGVVQGYELSLLGAAWLLARRGLARDVRNIVVFVVAPFLMDISCTNSLTAEQTGTWGGHLLAAGGVLALVAAKAWAASRLVERSFRPIAWAALLAGPVVVTAAPLVTSFLAHHGFAGPELALAGGLTLAGLIFLWGQAHDPEAADAGPLRALAPVVLGVATWHALGNAWTHGGSPGYVVGPALIALGPVLPRLGWPTVAARDAWTPLLLPVAGALCCGLPGLDAPEAFIGLSAWQLGLVGAAVVHGISFRRHGALPFLLGVLAAVDLAHGGVTLHESLRQIGRGAAEPVVLTALFAYGLLRRAPAAVVFPPLALAALLTYRLEAFGRLDAPVALDLLAAGLLAWTHRTHGRDAAAASFRFTGCLLLWLPVHVLALDSTHVSYDWLGRGTLVALLALAAATRVRAYAVPALLLPLDLARHASPTTTAGWGAVGIGLAFVAIALGVVVSLRREAILAWLERAGAEAERPVEHPRSQGPAQAPLGGSLALATVAGLLLVAIALGLSGGKRGHGRSNEARAIGALKTISVAQTLFREGDRDQDGALDYGTLAELAQAGLIADDLGRGELPGYALEVAVGAEHPEFLWLATATNLEGDGRYFAINHAGVVYMSPKTPFPLTIDGSIVGGVCVSK
jgi:hypothetical protein